MFELGTGEELIWNLASDSAALLAELETLFDNDPGSNDVDGVLNVTGLLGVNRCTWGGRL